VLTRLIEGEENGERLTETELLHQCIFLLNAGHETTTNLIGNALHALAEWPEEKSALIGAVTNDDRMRLAVEEFLRFESSNQLGNRITTREVQVGGVTLPPRSRITLCIGAANRDPAQFAEPDRLDLARDPNRHVAFGSGIHTCAGMNLAPRGACCARAVSRALPELSADRRPGARRSRPVSGVLASARASGLKARPEGRVRERGRGADVWKPCYRN